MRGDAPPCSPRGACPCLLAPRLCLPWGSERIVSVPGAEPPRTCSLHAGSRTPTRLDAWGKAHGARPGARLASPGQGAGRGSPCHPGCASSHGAVWVGPSCSLSVAMSFADPALAMSLLQSLGRRCFLQTTLFLYWAGRPEETHRVKLRDSALVLREERNDPISVSSELSFPAVAPGAGRCRRTAAVGALQRGDKPAQTSASPSPRLRQGPGGDTPGTQSRLPRWLPLHMRSQSPLEKHPGPLRPWPPTTFPLRGSLAPPSALTY